MRKIGLNRIVWITGALACCGGTLLPARASAQTALPVQTGYAADSLQVSERGSRWFVLDSLDFKGDGRLALGIVGAYGWRPLRLYRPDDQLARAVVRDQWVANFGASFFFADRVRIAVNVPLQLSADGRGTAVGGALQPAVSKDAAVGDVRLGADVRLLGEDGDAFTAAIGAQLFAPAGSPEAYNGDGEPRVRPRLQAAGTLGAFVYGAAIGGHFRGRNERFGESNIGHEAWANLGAGLETSDKKSHVGVELYGHQVMEGSPRTFPLEVLLGANHKITEDLRLGAAGAAGLSRGYGAASARALLLLEWVPGLPARKGPPPDQDTDGDGVPDIADMCPTIPKGEVPDLQRPGCPAPDRDGDLVADAVDACPDVKGVASADHAKNGCPPDQDGDGIPDDKDACPTEAGPTSTDPTKNGCPVPKDRDGDGIVDAEDACPDEKGVRSADAKLNGCPDPDPDKDGILGSADACPNAAGKANPDPKKNGCPMAFIQGDSIRITEQVKFKLNSAQILPGKDSEEVLQAVQAVLSEHAEIKKLRIEGHTDNTGSAAINRKLSADRAQSVVKWLVGHGIDATRLHSEGFGPDKPLTTNDTNEGRAENRRVEFHIEPATGESR